MKKFLLSTVALVGFAGVASAADLPRRVAPPPVVPIIPAFTWTGFYFGVNAGAAFDTGDDGDDLFGDRSRRRLRSVLNSPGTNGTLTLRDNGGFFDGDDGDVGFAGGGQIGFNYQFTPGSGFVVGFEADIQYIDLGDDADRNNLGQGLGYTFTGVPGLAFSPPAARVFRERNLVSSLDYFGTVRGRLGYAFDRTLIYATGGFAYAGGDRDDPNDIFVGFNRIDNGDDTRFGWTVGGGVEFAFTNLQLFGSSTVTFGIEGLYVNLEEGDNNNLRRGDATFLPRSNIVVLHNRNGDDDSVDFAVVRAKLNFKF